MPEPPVATGDPLPAVGRIDVQVLQTTALRYAAGDLNATETVAFETLLASEQDARDALSEAVRLSAAALGQTPPAPHHSFRAAIQEQLAGWCPDWLARRAYRGHPVVWLGLGAATVAACTIFGLSMAREESVPIPTPVAIAPLPPAQLSSAIGAPEPRLVVPEPAALAPDPRERVTVVMASIAGGENLAGNARSVAEIWADLSTPDHVGKAHDDELRWRQKLRDIGSLHPVRPGTGSAAIDTREP